MKNNGIDPATFEEIKKRQMLFHETLDNVNCEPVNVYRPLCKKALDELYLNREVSKSLQAKKDEDVMKAAQAAKEQAEAATVEKAQQKTEEATEK